MSSAKIDILHITGHFIIIRKPHNLVFKNESGKNDLLSQIYALEDESKFLEPGERLFAVHRLDKVTSGLMVFARGRKAANEIGNEFRFNRTQKVYAALTVQSPKKKHGVVTGDMEKSRRGTYKLTHSKSNPAKTCYTSFALPGSRPGLRLFLLKPVTGKTHQIRVAMKSIGSPILGDPLYDRFDSARKEERTYLHAMALAFEHNGQLHRFTDYPKGFEFDNVLLQETLNEIQDPFMIRWPSACSKISYSDKPDRRKPAVSGPEQLQKKRDKPGRNMKRRPSGLSKKSRNR